MRSVVERYQTDPEFRALVDVLASQIYAARYTPTEIREAAIMASTIVEAHTIRPMIIPLRDFDDLRPRLDVRENLAICEICQIRVPERLATFGVGVRGGNAAWCAACKIPPGPAGEAARQEVIALRRARSSEIRR